MMKISHLLTAVMLGFASVCSAQDQVTPDDFEKKLSKSDKPQLLDVRTPKEYSEGHLAKSRNIDYKSPEFKNQLAALDKSKPVYVYCLGGVRSAGAAKVLKENGFTEVYDMQGGYLKWTSAGKPVEGEKASSGGMSVADFNKMVSAHDVVLVDFYAPWCAPCMKMLPTIEKMKKEYAGKAKIETVLYDDNKQLAKDLNISEIPAFLLYKNGKLVKRVNGYMDDKALKDLITSAK